VRLVDTHLHLWDPALIPCSWCAGIPALDRSFGLDDYARAAAGTGITKAVFVECDVDDPHQLAEARRIEAIAAAHPLVAGIVASGRPESADFPAHLDALAALPHVRGLRRVLHVVRDDLCLEPRFAANVRRLGPLGLTFDLCARPHQLPAVLRLVEACPEVTFILDHCGLPDLRGGDAGPWRAALARLAAHPRLHCKVSGLVTQADPARGTAADLRPWFGEVVAAFGPRRIVWGGDWPVCTLASPLSRWVDATRELAADLAPADQARFLHLNAESLYRV
jgi:predicted TIM-barrel fold metal-dependent hydrolase